MIWHSIFNIIPNTAPSYLSLQEARLNYTFRYTPELTGQEALFATQRVEALQKDNQFYKTSLMK